MYKANRIGTPNMHALHNGTSDWNMASPALVLQNYNAGASAVNIVNATPATGFNSIGVSTQTQIATIARQSKYALGQQFSVAKPLEGNTIGVELTGNLAFNCMDSAIARPVFGRLAAAVSPAFTGATPTDVPVQIAEGSNMVAGSTTGVSRRQLWWKTQIILLDADFGKVYWHGVEVQDFGTGGTATFGAFHGRFCIRRLEDIELTLKNVDPYR